MRTRRSDYDITNDVQLSHADKVCEAVCTVFSNTFTQFDKTAIKKAFEDCECLYEGHYPGFLPCDTLYHDKQHTMDTTLAVARLINGYERSVAKSERLGAERALITIITALYHDSGYIRHTHDHLHANGAEYTSVHVSRSAEFLKHYLHEINLDKYTQIATSMLHYTGCEIAVEHINLPDEKWHQVGCLLGTADLIAQLSDRCYLEKCRDRLYPELVIGGLTVGIDEQGNENIKYQSGEDLLCKTPDFYANEVEDRLNVQFNRAYNYESAHFDGERPYLHGLGQNQARLKKILQANDFSMLRRTPPENYGTKNFPGLESYLDQHPLNKTKLG
jgi:hypothetical protein